jgi:acyl carrier protein
MRRPVPIADVKRLIIESLNLPGVRPADIEDDAPLFGAGLGLDSVDALELVVALEKTYGIQVADDQIGRKVFASARTLTDFVNERLVAPGGVAAGE